MTDKRLTYSKKIIDIADTLFANPTKEVSAIVSDIVEGCQKSDRTVWRWIKKAQDYNRERIRKQEEAKDEILVESAKESLRKDILSRERALEILTKIAEGVARSPKGIDEIMIPTDADRTRAIQQLSKMQGWEAPAKTESDVTISSLSDEERAILLAMAEKMQIG